MELLGGNEMIFFKSSFFFSYCDSLSLALLQLSTFDEVFWTYFCQFHSNWFAVRWATPFDFPDSRRRLHLVVVHLPHHLLGLLGHVCLDRTICLFHRSTHVLYLLDQYNRNVLCKRKTKTERRISIQFPHSQLCDSSTNLVMQSMPIISSLNEPSSFSNPQVIVPSSFSSRYLRRIWATGFFSRPYNVKEKKRAWIWWMQATNS